MVFQCLEFCESVFSSDWRLRGASDTRTGGDDGVLGDDDDTVANCVLVGLGAVGFAVRGDVSAVTDAGVFVYDGVADVAVSADAHAWEAGGRIFFEEVRAHNDGVLDDGSFADAGAYADDGVEDAVAGDDAAFG